MAAFLAYVWLVDRLWSHIPRFIMWGEAHPGWLRHALASAAATASSPEALRQAGAGLVASAQQAAAGCAAALQQAGAGLAEAANPAWLRAALLGLLAAAKHRLAGA